MKNIGDDPQLGMQRHVGAARVESVEPNDGENVRALDQGVDSGAEIKGLGCSGLVLGGSLDAEVNLAGRSIALGKTNAIDKGDEPVIVIDLQYQVGDRLRVGNLELPACEDRVAVLGNIG